MADAYLKEGDTAPSLRSPLFNPDGSRANINGATVRLYLWRIRTGEVIIDGETGTNLTGVDADNDVEYEWAASLEAGGYEYEWEIEYVGGEVETFPNDRKLTLSVDEEIAEAAS